MRLKDIREESELKQFTVSKKLGISRGTYSLWELELDPIPIKRLNDFCNIFNCSIDYALGFTNIKNYKHSRPDININLSSIRLREARKAYKMTQEVLGKKLDINRSLISKYEKGHTIISTTFLIEYVKLFKLSSDYLLGKIDNKIRLLTTKYEGIIQETKKEFDELDSSIKDSIGQGGQKLFSYNFSNSALARYISMLYYRHLGQMDDVRIDLQAVDKAFSSQPHLYPFLAPQKIKDELNVKPSDGRLNIISFAGRFPVKVESVVSFFIDTVYVKFAFPELKARPSVVSSVEVEVENVGTFTLEKIEDMSLIAGETFNQKRDIIYSRSLLRGISKGVATAASTVAVSQSGAQNGDTAGLAMLVNIIGNIYSDVSEQADLRLSRYFPGVAYVGGITLPSGIYNVRVNYKNKNGYVIYSEYFKDVDVKSGDLNLRESVCLR